MNNKFSETLLDSIGDVSSDKLETVDKMLQDRTSKRSKSFMSIQFAGMAAALVLLAVGTVAMFHFLAPDDPANLNPNLPLSEAHVPAINTPRVWIENWTVSSPKTFIPHWHNPLTESEYPHKDDLPVITHYTIDTSKLEGGGWNMDYFRERNEFKISVVFDETPQHVNYTLFGENGEWLYTSQTFSAPFEPGDYILEINVNNDSEIYVIRLFHGGHRDECNRIDTYHGGGAGLKVHDFDTLLEIRDLLDTDDSTIATYFKTVCDGQEGRIWECPCFIQTKVDLQSFFSWTRLDQVRLPFSDTASIDNILLRERYGDIYVRYTIGDMLFNFEFNPASFLHGNTESFEGWGDNGMGGRWLIERLTTVGDVNIYTHELYDGEILIEDDPTVVFILSVNGAYMNAYISIPCKNPDTCEQEWFDRGNGHNCRGEWVDRQAAIDGIMSFEFKTLFENTGANNHPLRQNTTTEPNSTTSEPPVTPPVMPEGTYTTRLTVDDKKTQNLFVEEIGEGYTAYRRETDTFGDAHIEYYLTADADGDYFALFQSDFARPANLWVGSVADDLDTMHNTFFLTKLSTEDDYNNFHHLRHFKKGERFRVILSIDAGNYDNNIFIQEAKFVRFE
jgi:hypothetical protein